MRDESRILKEIREMPIFSFKIMMKVKVRLLISLTKSFVNVYEYRIALT